MIARTERWAEVRVESYRGSCSSSAERFVPGEGGAWVPLASPPYESLLYLDGEVQQPSMCCLDTCEHAETVLVDVQRYRNVGTHESEQGDMPAYESTPVEGALRARLSLYVDPTCSIPRTVVVDL